MLKMSHYIYPVYTATFAWLFAIELVRKLFENGLKMYLKNPIPTCRFVRTSKRILEQTPMWAGYAKSKLSYSLIYRHFYSTFTDSFTVQYYSVLKYISVEIAYACFASEWIQQIAFFFRRRDAAIEYIVWKCEH